MAWDYTQIKHKPRIQLGLSNDEYCLLDLIYQRSRAINAPVKNWCITSQSNICKDLGFSTATGKRMMKRLKENGFIESDHSGKKKRTLPKFYEIIYSQEQYQNDPHNGIKMTPNRKTNGIKSTQERYQNDTKNGIKMTHSNIVSNISKVISSLSEQSSPLDNPIPFVKIILQYLSTKTGSKFRIPDNDGDFRASAKFTIINARLRQKYSPMDLINVIDIKCSEWLEDERMKKYLKPDTLFRASNFEKYLDQYEGSINSEGSQKPQTKKEAQQAARKKLEELWRKHKNLWHYRYTNQAKTNYVEALKLFYFHNPTLKPKQDAI